VSVTHLGTRALSRARWAPLLTFGVAAALALAVLPLQIAGWLVLGGAALAAIVLAPLFAVYAVPFAVAFGSLFPLDVRSLHAGPTDLLVAGLVLAWLVRQWPALVPTMRAWLREPAALPAHLRLLWRRDHFRFTIFACLLTYLAVIILSAAVATDRASVLKETLKWSEVTALVALGLWQIRTPRQVRALAWAFIAAGVAQALLGYAQWVVSSGDIYLGGGDIRVFGTFAQPNPFSGYLNFALVLALSLVLFAHDIRERWVAGAASVLLLGAQALANSRGGLLGLLAALVVLVVVGLRRERLAIIAALVALPLVAVALVLHIVPARIQSALLDTLRVSNVTVCGQVNARNFSTVERVAHWLAGLRMFAAHPMLGVGAGNYNAAYARYACPDWPESLGHAHNYYINAAAETGIIGLAAFLCLTAALLYLGWRASRVRIPSPLSATASSLTASSAPLRALALGFFAVVVALTVHNLTDDLFVHAMELQVALTTACLLRLLAISAQLG
jgi:O-antigen ligase